MKRNEEYWKHAQLKSLADALLQGKTNEEAAAEFGYKADWTRKKLVWIKQDYPELYALIKTKPYRALQRVIYTGCTLEEALKTFNISEKTFWTFMNERILKSNPYAYIRIRSHVHNQKIQNR